MFYSTLYNEKLAEIAQGRYTGILPCKYNASIEDGSKDIITNAPVPMGLSE